MTKDQMQEKINSLTSENTALREENTELRSRLKKYEIAEIMEAFRNSDKSYDELMTFLKAD